MVINAPTKNHPYQNQYDPDFSPPSTPDPSGSEYEKPTSIDPELKTILPTCFFEPPVLTSSFKWCCQVPDCNYLIDFFNLTDENVTGLAGDYVSWLRKLEYGSLPSLHVEKAFYHMVDQHFMAHMNKWGVKCENTGTEKVGLIVLLKLFLPHVCEFPGYTSLDPSKTSSTMARAWPRASPSQDVREYGTPGRGRGSSRNSSPADHTTFAT